MQLGKCEQEAAQWFLKRGMRSPSRYDVAMERREARGLKRTRVVHTPNSFGQDWRSARYRRGREFRHCAPFVRRDGAIVIGQSAGGWGTLAYNALSPKVSAFIVMAGGRGGHEHDRPNSNCHPVLLVQAARLYGKTASTPMLWIYARNDTYFSPHIAGDFGRPTALPGSRLPWSSRVPMTMRGIISFGPWWV